MARISIRRWRFVLAPAEQSQLARCWPARLSSAAFWTLVPTIALRRIVPTVMQRRFALAIVLLRASLLPMRIE